MRRGDAATRSVRARPKLLMVAAALLLAARVATGVGEALRPERAGGLVHWHLPGDAEVTHPAGGRPVLYDFSAAWCQPCKAMDREVFSDPATANDINQTFVPVRVADEDRSSAADALRAKHSILSLPTLVITGGSRTPRPLQGYPGKSQTLGFLRAAAR